MERWMRKRYREFSWSAFVKASSKASRLRTIVKRLWLHRAYYVLKHFIVVITFKSLYWTLLAFWKAVFLITKSCFMPRNVVAGLQWCCLTLSLWLPQPLPRITKSTVRPHGSGTHNRQHPTVEECFWNHK